MFSIVDGEPIIEAPLVNLKVFKDLWKADDSDDKHIYKNWMLYVYYMCDYRSDFYELQDKETRILLEIFGDRHIKAPRGTIKCMEEYTQRNCPAEQRALDSAIIAAENINSTLSQVQQNARQMDDVISGLDREIKNSTDILVKVELMKEKFTLQDKQFTLIKNCADLIPKIEKSVESIINLRSKVEKAMLKLVDSKERIENYIIDDFIASRERGEFN